MSGDLKYNLDEQEVCDLVVDIYFIVGCVCV